MSLELERRLTDAEAARDFAQGHSVAHAITIGRLKDALELCVGMLGELEECLDAQIYPEQVKDDFDAPDDRIYELTMTAEQWRIFGKTHQQAIDALAQLEKNSAHTNYKNGYYGGGKVTP